MRLKSFARIKINNTKSPINKALHIFILLASNSVNISKNWLNIFYHSFTLVFNQFFTKFNSIFIQVNLIIDYNADSVH